MHSAQQHQKGAGDLTPQECASAASATGGGQRCMVGAMGAPAAALPCMKPFRTCASISLTTPGVCGRNTADDLRRQHKAVRCLALEHAQEFMPA